MPKVIGVVIGFSDGSTAVLWHSIAPLLVVARIQGKPRDET